MRNKMEMNHVLVVEDDKEIREGVEIYLKSQGYEVFQAADGVEGLEVIEKEDIHLAIVDIMMPRMDGISMVVKLREKYDFPVIFLSAKSEEVDKIMGLTMGADDYVTKPFTPMELLARVNSQLRRYRRFMERLEDKNENSRIHTALTVMVIDSYGTKQEEAEEKVQKALGIQDDPYEIVTVDESLRTGEDGVALESYSQMAFTTKVSARAVDVLIGSEDYMDGFEFKDEYFMDLTELLPEDVYQVFGEQDDKYSITIDSDELAEELEVTYEPVKIGVLANSENVENAVKWLTKLAEELS